MGVTSQLLYILILFLCAIHRAALSHFFSHVVFFVPRIQSPPVLLLLFHTSTGDAAYFGLSRSAMDSRSDKWGCSGCSRHQLQMAFTATSPPAPMRSNATLSASAGSSSLRKDSAASTVSTHSWPDGRGHSRREGGGLINRLHTKSSRGLPYWHTCKGVYYYRMFFSSFYSRTFFFPNASFFSKFSRE